MTLINAWEQLNEFGLFKLLKGSSPFFCVCVNSYPELINNLSFFLLFVYYWLDVLQYESYCTSRVYRPGMQTNNAKPPNNLKII